MCSEGVKEEGFPIILSQSTLPWKTPPLLKKLELIANAALSSVVLDISKELVALIVRVVIPPLIRAIIANLPESTSFHLILSITIPLYSL